MTFKKGDPRPPGAGRQKGRPTKKRVLKVHEVLEKNNKDPVVELLALIPQLKPHEQAKVWLELQSYIQGKSTKSPDEAPTAQDQDPRDNTDDATVLKILNAK